MLSAGEKFIRQTAGIVGVVKGHAIADMPGNAAVHSGTAELHVLQLACGIFMLQTCMTVAQAKAHLITPATRFDPAGLLHLFKKSGLPRGPCGLDKPRGDVAPANTAEGLAGPNSPCELPCKAAPVRLRPMAVSKSVSKSCSCSCNNLDAIKLWGNFGAQKGSIATGHMNTLLCPLPMSLGWSPSTLSLTFSVRIVRRMIYSVLRPLGGCPALPKLWEKLGVVPMFDVQICHPSSMKSLRNVAEGPMVGVAQAMPAIAPPFPFPLEVGLCFEQKRLRITLLVHECRCQTSLTSVHWMWCAAGRLGDLLKNCRSLPAHRHQQGHQGPGSPSCGTDVSLAALHPRDICGDRSSDLRRRISAIQLLQVSTSWFRSNFSLPSVGYSKVCFQVASPIASPMCLCVNCSLACRNSLATSLLAQLTLEKLAPLKRSPKSRPVRCGASGGSALVSLTIQKPKELEDWKDGKDRPGLFQAALIPVVPLAKALKCELARTMLRQPRLSPVQEAFLAGRFERFFVSWWRLISSVPEELLKAAVMILQERHWILRSTFNSDMPLVSPKRFDVVETRDVPEEGQEGQDLEQIAREFAWQPLDLKNSPAIRVLLVTFGSDSQAESAESKCLLVVKVHHVACDGLSAATLDKELCALLEELCALLDQECSTNAGHNQYGPLCLNPVQSAMNALCLELPPSPGQFHRYVQWMHGQHLSSESGHRDRAFWSQQFASLQLPVMPMPESHGQHTVEIIFPKEFPAKHAKLLALFAYWLAVLPDQTGRSHHWWPVPRPTDRILGCGWVLCAPATLHHPNAKAL